VETFCIVGLQTNDLRSRPRRIQEISAKLAEELNLREQPQLELPLSI